MPISTSPPKKYTVMVKRWGYTEKMQVEADSKYLAVIKAREMCPGYECFLPKEGK